MTAYQVTAPLVVVKQGDGRYVHVYSGGLLPDDADTDHVAQLVDTGMVAAAGESDDKPAGNASREEWEAYAVANGKTAEEMAEMSRNDIRDLFA